MAFLVYILKCADGSYYTGHTDDLEKRLAEHQSASIPGCYTTRRLPVQLVFLETFATRYEALSAERQIKGWSRAKKEAMMRGDWVEVSRLARSRAKSPPDEPPVNERDFPFKQTVVPQGRSLPFDPAQGERGEGRSVRAELVEARPSTLLRANGRSKPALRLCSGRTGGRSPPFRANGGGRSDSFGYLRPLC